uniref:Uncharacterized protein LOC104211504 n=1 Tax=Nicotiana sylvestris TaxID=4096 RepID=A0A1U7V1M9_NICSY|nr:PREDICTED: uncharacterized protein LOC104211504 [Nicotiana sylvestris]
METLTMSYDIKVWRMIIKENLPIPPKKDENGHVIVSTDPLDLDDYTEEQSVVITVNAKEKSLLYNAISAEEYKKISSCETAKEIWNKLEYLDKIFYHELRGDLVALEKTHLNRQIQQEKKKTVVIKAIMVEPENEEKEEGGEQDENISMLSQVVTSMIRKNINSNKAECPELKKKLSRNFQKKKSFGGWSDEEESYHEEIANMCFMDIDGDSDENSDIEKVLNELQKSKKKRKIGLGSWKFRIRGENASENSNNPLYFYFGKLDHTSNHCMFKNNRRWSGTRKKNRKGKWYLDSACSRHTTGEKKLFKTDTKLDGGTVTFGDKSKGNVIGVGRVPLSSTCDVYEVYLVEELGYNLLSIN